MFKFIFKLILGFFFISFLIPASPRSKTVERPDNSALKTPLLVSAVLGAGAGLYALWHTVSYTDVNADKLAEDLTLCRWREQSLWPLHHTWWSAEDMKKHRKSTIHYLKKDFKYRLLVDKKGKNITAKSELQAAISNELNELYETKTACTISSYVTAWFGGSDTAQHNQAKEISVDRLIGRLQHMKEIAAFLP